MTKYLPHFTILLTIFLFSCNSSQPNIQEENTEETTPTTEVIEEIPETTPQPSTIEIPEHNVIDERYNLVLETPSTWGKVDYMVDRGGYGTGDEPFSFEVYGQHYTIATVTYNKDGVRFYEPIFMITSIAKEYKDHEAIPETDEYITEYGDYAYFLREITEDQNLLQDIPDILNT